MALNTQDGIKKILLSGLRATVIMDEGKELDQEKSATAIKAKGLELKSFEKAETPIPAAAYQIAAAGTG